MAVDIHREIHQGLDEVTADRREFIRKAFHILPKLDRPRILDIGCGRGGPTLELARLSGGKVIGVDIDAQALDELAARAAVEGLSEHIRGRNCSMSAMDFEEESFDVIWAEASLHVMGFEEGLDAWRRFLGIEDTSLTNVWSGPGYTIALGSPSLHITKPGHPTAIGVSLILDLDHKYIQFFEMNSAIKGYGGKMVDAVLKDLPKAWNGVVVMDRIDGFGIK